jgi:uncharacterized membrane protein YsdA (DUF1294 family)
MKREQRGKSMADQSASPRRNQRSAGRVDTGDVLRWLGAAAILGLAAAAVALGRAPLLLPIAYLVVGLIALVMYIVNKRAARLGRWRVPESNLHVADLVGGIAGGLAAQQLLHHKTRKPSFVITTLLIALLHVVGLMALIAGFWGFPASFLT